MWYSGVAIGMDDVDSILINLFCQVGGARECRRLHEGRASLVCWKHIRDEQVWCNSTVLRQ
jgi:hypothetical protein